MARAAVLLLVSLLLALASASPHPGDRGPRSVPNAPGSKFAPQLEFSLAKSYKRAPPITRKRQATVTLALPIADPPIWTAVVGLGTPTQSVAVLLDTGSANLATVPPPGSGCSGCSTSSAYAFNPATSTTWQDLNCGTARCTPTTCTACNTGQLCGYSIDYADGSNIAGHVGIDSFSLGGYTISNATFGTTTTISANFFADDPNSNKLGGIMGLGYGSLSCWRDPPPIQQLLSQTPSLYQGFTFCLQTTGGTWILGEDYSTSPISYSWANMLDPTTAASGGHYSSYLAGMRVNGAALPGVTNADYTSTYLVFDTGSTYNYVSQVIFDALSSELEAACNTAGIDSQLCSRLFTDPSVSGYCYRINQAVLDTLPPMEVQIQAGAGPVATLTVPAAVYLRHCSGPFWTFSFSASDNSAFCTSKMFRYEIYFKASPPNILGNSLLAWFRVAYDIAGQRIGFAGPDQCAGWTGYNMASANALVASVPLLVLLTYLLISL